MLTSRVAHLAAASLCLATLRSAEAQVAVAAKPTHPVGVLSIMLAIPGRPHGVAATPDGRFCISQVDAHTVTCGQLLPNGVLLDSAVSVGQTPAHVALSPSGTHAYTADQHAASMTIVDVRTQKATGTVRLSGEGFNLLTHPTAARVYVTTGSGTLHVIDVRSQDVLARLSVGSAANGLAFDAPAGLLYVSSRDAGRVTALQTATNMIMRTYTVDAMPQRIAVSPDGRTLYVATESTGLNVLDLESGVRDSVSGVKAGAVGLALSPDGAHVYVVSPTAGTVQIVDAATRTVISTLRGYARPRNVTFTLGGAAALVTGEGGRLYVFR